MAMRLSDMFGLWANIVLRLTGCVAAGLVVLLAVIHGIMPLLPLPDSQIIFESDADGDADIYRLDMRYNIAINLTRNSVDDHDAAWSPATGQIAYASVRDENGLTDIEVMDAQGRHPHRVTPPEGNYWNPSWSPDGRSLVYLLNYGNIHVADFSADTEHYLNYGFNPAWSPVDNRIASYANTQADVNSQKDLNADVYVIDADGRNPRNITQYPANDWDPAWSPDGKQLVFVSARDGNAELYISELDCAACPTQRLTYHPGADTTPAWSPDGSQIVFASDVDGVSWIYVMNIDDIQLRAVLPGRAPAWVEFLDR